ncbi:MAG: hypothetical protein HZC47_11565 [Methanobacterium sp.]|uniref:hypothetical protein n=1 Tax=Methanobacterium sp. TaxID=2164 RepID=UPI003D659A2B|nr:hypothetical protein [Methanobacterium sp.]
MDKLTIGLMVIIVIIAGVIGYIFGSQNSESLPIILSNNTTNDSGLNSDITKTTKTKNKTSTTTKKNTTTVINKTQPTPNGTCSTALSY